LLQIEQNAAERPLRLPTLGSMRKRPQRPRIQIADGVYHITARGNRQRAIYTDVWSRERFLILLDDVVDRMRWQVHAYCLMTNHYHLLVETPDSNISRGMERLNGIYARWFNWRHGFEGHLFGRRFHDEMVERDAHLLELSRYIVLNPVRAKMCAHPSEWQWSSYNATVANGEPAPFLTVEWLLSQFGTPASIARRHYAEFVETADAS
jgi:putative transposase